MKSHPKRQSISPKASELTKLLSKTLNHKSPYHKNGVTSGLSNTLAKNAVVKNAQKRRGLRINMKTRKKRLRPLRKPSPLKPHDKHSTPKHISIPGAISNRNPLTRTQRSQFRTRNIKSSMKK